MIETFEVCNFRGFHSATIDKLRRVNLIVGKSASGKTALLEAIRLALGATPQVAWNLAASRGILPPLGVNPTREQFESAWSHYFPDFDVTSPIILTSTDTLNRAASLKMYFDEERAFTPLPQAQPQYNVPNTVIPLAFDRQNFLGEQSSLLATVQQLQQPQPWVQLYLQQGPELGIVSDFFPSTWQSNAQLVAQWFSQLRIVNQEEEIIRAVKAQFDELEEISPELPQGSPAMWAKLKHHPRKLPLSLVSSGVNKLVSLLIAIKTYRGGVVLVDEIENGIYYGMYKSLWHSLHQAAVNSNTQIFMTTHSWECLKSATETIDSHPKDFSLLQVFQHAGQGEVIVTDGPKASAAISSGIEIRR
jgi:ABC-type lipoprotein export system ATPase subunit